MRISYLMAAYHLLKSIVQRRGTLSLMHLVWLVGVPFVGWISDGIKSRQMPLTAGITS